MSLPKGKIFIIGGAEYKSDGRALSMEEYNKDFEPFEILRGLLPGKKAGKSIEIIPTASRVPEEIWEMYKDAFSKLGFDNVNLLDIRTREDAANDEFISRIEKAHTIFFTGGSQFRLSTILGGTRILKAIEEKYCDDEDFIIDASNIKCTNIVEAEDYTPLCAEGLNVHILSSGNGYLIREREFLSDIKNPGKNLLHNVHKEKRVFHDHLPAKKS